MAHFHRQAEERKDHGCESEQHAEPDVARQSGDVVAPPVRAAARFLDAESEYPAMVSRKHRVQLAHGEDVVGPARKEPRKPQQHAGICGEQERGPKDRSIP